MNSSTCFTLQQMSYELTICGFVSFYIVEMLISISLICLGVYTPL